MFATNCWTSFALDPWQTTLLWTNVSCVVSTQLHQRRHWCWGTRALSQLLKLQTLRSWRSHWQFDILCNASTVMVFVMGQKYTYNNPHNFTTVPSVTKVRRICGLNCAVSQRQILLLTTIEHYDSLEWPLR